MEGQHEYAGFMFSWLSYHAVKRISQYSWLHRPIGSTPITIIIQQSLLPASLYLTIPLGQRSNIQKAQSLNMPWQKLNKLVWTALKGFILSYEMLTLLWHSW
jgi:hypothetical protein